MRSPRGRTIPLSRQRRLIGDIMWLAHGVPVATFKRRMRLGPLRDTRAMLAERPPWALLFAKGYALIAAECPEFRRLFVPFPGRRLHEHPESIVRLAIERAIDGEPGAIPVRFVAPDRMPLAELMWQLRHLRDAPQAEVGAIRRMLAPMALPRRLRRLGWLGVLNVSAGRRARTLGTYAVTMTGGAGAGAVSLPSPVAVTLHCGVINAADEVDVFATFDHRVHDGLPIARVLTRLEETMNGPIRDEVARLAAR